jgi:hypothetical protein
MGSLLHFARRGGVKYLPMEIMMVFALITVLGVIMNDIRLR